MKIKLISEVRYKNSLKKLLKDLIESGKMGELYKGYAVALVYIIEGMIQLGIYEELKKDYNGYFSFFCIGVLAKFIGISLTYPYRVILAILQSRNIDVFTAIRYTVKTSGIHGLYKGYSACLARNLPPSGFMFMLLELLRNILTQILYMIINT